MSKSPREAGQEVSDLIDRLGRNMSPEDWIDFLDDVESGCEAKRHAAEEELDD